MKIVLNKCYGGFGLSPLALKNIAKRKGKELYFFKIDGYGENSKYTPLTLEEAKDNFITHHYTVPNPQDYDLHKRDDSGTFKDANKRAEKISLPYFRNEEHRTDEDLIKVVEELGEKANGDHARLRIVDIPDDLDYEIDDYDGIETLRETHRTW